MRTEQEIKDEMKWARYERFKKRPCYSAPVLDGYYHALRWVLEKEESAYHLKKKETQKDTDKLIEEMHRGLAKVESEED